VSDFASVVAKIEGVEGWLTDAQARRLWDSAAALAPGARIVEIGAFRGRSTIVLASAAPAGTEVVTVDPHGGGDRGPHQIVPDARLGERDYAAFRANLRDAGVDDLVRHVRASSHEALEQVEGPIDLLYVDGAHRYGPAREDIERWGARVKPGGTMLVHDAFNAIGVTLAQLRVLLLSPGWAYRGRRGSLAEYRRAQLDARERALDALTQLAELPYFARNLLVKLLIVARLRRLAALLGHRQGDWPY
jgi:predicted O-methyltransferase YrrM